MDRLNRLLDLVEAHNLYPLLIHCWGGQHRSPNTALYAATRRAKFNADEFQRLRKRMTDLRPDVQWLEFGESMDRRCRPAALPPLWSRTS